MKFNILVTCEHDDDEMEMDVIHMIESILVYMVDNVKNVEVRSVLPGSIK